MKTLYDSIIALASRGNTLGWENQDAVDCADWAERTHGYDLSGPADETKAKDIAEEENHG